MSIDVRTKDPCRFCKERNLSGCSGTCGVQIPNIEEDILSDMKTHRELLEENAKLKEQLEVAGKMIEYMADALIVSINEKKFSIDNVDKTISYFKHQALEQMQKVGNQ